MAKFPKITAVRVLILMACVVVGLLITYGLPDWISYGLGAGFIVFAGSTLGERWRRADAEAKR